LVWWAFGRGGGKANFQGGAHSILNHNMHEMSISAYFFLYICVLLRLHVNYFMIVLHFLLLDLYSPLLPPAYYTTAIVMEKAFDHKAMTDQLSFVDGWQMTML